MTKGVTGVTRRPRSGMGTIVSYARANIGNFVEKFVKSSHVVFCQHSPLSKADFRKSEHTRRSDERVSDFSPALVPKQAITRNGWERDYSSPFFSFSNP
jgi:hypothetical protein